MLALAGCGGDEDGGGGDPPTKAEFQEQADRLCRETDDKGTALIGEAFADPNDPQPEEAQQFVKDAVPIQRDLLSELRELDRPEGDEDEIERWLDAADEGTGTVEEASESPEASMELIQATGDGPLAEANKLATEFGLDDCSN